jgi:hypothetical protein
MAWRRCLVRGENFPLVRGGELRLFGFYATRFVEASTPEEAEDKVSRAILTDPALGASMGALGAERARIHFEEIAEVERPAADEGFSFFPMEETD